MRTTITNHPVFGKSLFVDNGVIEVGIPLCFGIRIGHVSYLGEENLFFEQPNDMEDLSTPEGWRVRGGHRLWLAPESEKVYAPDNAPVTYEISGNSVMIYQANDPLLQVKKSMKLTFSGDNGVVVDHQIQNTGNKPRKCSLWAITSMAPGGIEHIPLNYRDGGYNPLHKISMWDYTNLGDCRAEYNRESIILKHAPLCEKYKIGVGHPAGAVSYANKGVIFEKFFDINPELPYPDGDVSFETFMCKHMVEIESLSSLKEISPNESAIHQEIWRLKRIEKENNHEY